MRNVILIGMPGCGKSTVGVLAAKALTMDFVDTDLLLQRKAGRPLQRMVDELGAEGFAHAMHALGVHHVQLLGNVGFRRQRQQQFLVGCVQRRVAQHLAQCLLLQCQQ